MLYVSHAIKGWSFVFGMGSARLIDRYHSVKNGGQPVINLIGTSKSTLVRYIWFRVCFAMSDVNCWMILSYWELQTWLKLPELYEQLCIGTLPDEELWDARMAETTRFV